VRSGLTRVILPERNRKDLEDISQDVRDRLEFVWASNVGDVLAAALGPENGNAIVSAVRPDNQERRPSLQ
jgi:ATP-dependent Lon protease